MNATIEKFGYPTTLIADYDHWVVLLRPKQVTAGCLVLACKDDVGAFSAISEAAFTELKTITADIEANLASLVHYDRINYLMLMMVDPHVHFHVVPRHAEPRTIAGATIADAAWPKPPDLTTAAQLTDETLTAIRDHIATCWRKMIDR
ncbi:MAG TPA: hypothetical protein VEC57_08675 [Candidatus Limnocylindrales bacterium]|nr:hypothetical protein [Candidatus Limnocylindrales bacterium]